MRILRTIILSTFLLVACEGEDVTHVRVPKPAARADVAAAGTAVGGASAERAASESGPVREESTNSPGSERPDAR